MKDDEVIGTFAGHPMTYGKVHQLLIKAGIIDEKGELTEQYQTEPEMIPAHLLQPGDLLTTGLVIKVDPTGEDDFWTGFPNVTVLDPRDSHFGPTVARTFDTDYEVVAQRGSKKYNDTVKGVIQEQLFYLKDRIELIEKLMEFLNVQNES